MGLRDKYKPTQMSVLKNKIDNEDQLVGSGGNNRPGFLEISQGRNTFRIFPVDDENETFYLMIAKHWITIEDNGEEKRRSVYNSKIHGGTKLDVFEEYISGVKKFLTENEDSNAQEKIKSMTDWKNGITMNTTWVCYANKIGKDKTKTFGILEYGKSVRDGINEIGTFEDENDPIDAEPFTDPDEGVPVIIDYDKTQKEAKNKYSVSIGTKPKPMPLSDEELEEYEKVPTLRSLYRGVYKASDFELACKGLQFFDETNEIGYWETDEWQEKLEKIAAQYKEDKKSKKSDSSKGIDFKKKLEQKKLASKFSKNHEEEEEEDEEEEETEEEEGDEFSSMDRLALKKYILKNKLDIIVKQKHSDEDIRNLIREAISQEVEEEEETEEESEEEPFEGGDDRDDDEEEEEEEKPTKSSAKKPLSLAEIKAKLKSKAK